MKRLKLSLRGLMLLVLLLAIGLAWIADSQRRARQRDKSIQFLLDHGAHIDYLGQKLESGYDQQGNFQVTVVPQSSWEQFVSRSLQGGRKVKSVFFYKEEFPPENWKHLQALPELQRLDFFRTPMETDSLKNLADLPNLKHLDLSLRRLNLRAPEFEVLMQLPHLKTLSLPEGTHPAIIAELEARLPRCWVAEVDVAGRPKTKIPDRLLRKQ